jgi:hypothetical protein
VQSKKKPDQRLSRTYGTAEHSEWAVPCQQRNAYAVNIIKSCDHAVPPRLKPKLSPPSGNGLSAVAT